MSAQEPDRLFVKAVGMIWLLKADAYPSTLSPVQTSRHGEGKVCPRPVRYDALWYYFARGSSASRKPSPNRLNDSTVMKIARPGKIAIHGALERKRCAEFSMEPQEG
jgi:hypothetical protein